MMPSTISPVMMEMTEAATSRSSNGDANCSAITENRLFFFPWVSTFFSCVALSKAYAVVNPLLLISFAAPVFPLNRLLFQKQTAHPYYESHNDLYSQSHL